MRRGRKIICVYVIFIIGSICFMSYNLSAQNLSKSQKGVLMKEYDKYIDDISNIDINNMEMMDVYNYNISSAEHFMKENEIYLSDNDIFAKNETLNNITATNKEIIFFLLPYRSDMFYSRSVKEYNDGKLSDAYKSIEKALAVNPNNVMASYMKAIMCLDSGMIVKSADILCNILSTMTPSDIQRKLCLNELHYLYDKNLLKSISFIKQGKYAYAYDILSALDTICAKDSYDICSKNIVSKNIEICKQGIYDSHIDITKKAIFKGQIKVAGDFVENTYDYFQRNRGEISDTSSFDGIVKTVVDGYIRQAKSMTDAKSAESRNDILLKAKNLSAMLSGEYESEVMKEISHIQGTTSLTDTKLDSIEDASPNIGYVIDYNNYVKDTSYNAEKEVEKIEKDYIPSPTNPQPKESLSVAVNKTTNISRQVDEQFYKSRQAIEVNDYDKALEILEKANKLAKIKGDKDATELMYVKAIREITAKRMSKAEYFIFQGEVEKSDSLVKLSNDLINQYNMQEDTAIVRIMNSYLRAIDNKVCTKKQDEINTLVYDIIDKIQQNDFYTAEEYINKAMAIKGNNECRLDKGRVRSLKAQIQEPLEYVKVKEDIDNILLQGDTMRYFLEYAKLEYFFNTHRLNELSVHHEGIRDILTAMKNDNLVIKTIENLIKYQQYEGAIESIGALKNMGYRAKHTKDVQKRIGEMMALKDMKRSEKIEQKNRIIDKYTDDTWFKYFLKSYKKNMKKYEREN